LIQRNAGAAERAGGHGEIRRANVLPAPAFPDSLVASPHPEQNGAKAMTRTKLGPTII
jgi:hypothetical protein